MMIASLRSRTRRLLLALVLIGLIRPAAGQAPQDAMVTLLGQRTGAAAAAQVVGRVPAAQPIDLTLALSPRDPVGLDELIRRLYDPQDAEYRRFLTPAQFTVRFSPTPAQYAAVAAYARAQGMTVTGTTPNHLLLHVQAPAAAIENAFGVRLRHYRDATGRLFHAPDADPVVPVAVAPLLTGVIGLDDSAVWHPHFHPLPEASALDALPLETGSGPGGGLTPTDIRAAYQLNNLTLNSAPLNGAGQTLAVFELDGYNPNDITGYENAYGLPNVPLQNKLIDNYSGAAGGGAAEVTLDIELQIALAPGAGKVLVYEGPNSGQGLIDVYNQIAVDDQAAQISTSWGLDEPHMNFQVMAGSPPAPLGILQAENNVFKQMAAQGQTLFAASGDSGAYDDSSTPTVPVADDPAAQPFVTGVGGTSLATAGAGGAWNGESVWNNGSASNGSSGGGISRVWPIPPWQVSAITPASLGSPTMRNVPDVALDANPNTGYSIYVNGGWAIYGGTSCTAPLWAAFTALVNQQRQATGLGTLGFANPALYAAAEGSYGGNDFHDITSGNNFFYPAVPGYDLATGWGTLNGANLLADLAPLPPADLTATAASATQITLQWNTVTNAVGYTVFRGTAHGGPYTQSGATTGATTFSDTGLTTGTTYFYVVTAGTSAETSGDSNEASATLMPPTGPTITVAAGATPNPVTGTTTQLAVLGADPAGENTLTYTWAASGPAPVAFSANGTNAAKTATATFTAAGSYSLTVTAADQSGLSAQSAVTVAVQQALAKLTLTPPSATVLTRAAQTFSATAADQFGATIASPALTWAASGGGTVNPSGTFTAGTTPGGPYTVTATAGSAHGSASVTVAAPVNAAVFVSQSVPSSMTAGQAYPVSVTFRNTGTTTWTSAGADHLGAQDPQDNTTWGLGRVLLPSGTTSVAPGASVTFAFTVKAPAQAGSYPFQWRMVQDGVQWFGDFTPVQAITVSGPGGSQTNGATYVSESVPTSMTSGQAYPVSVMFRNTGNTTWTSGGNYHLGVQDPQDNATWGPGRIYLPASTPSVAPGQSVTFSFSVTAPAQAGSYPFQWRMVQDGVQWFGDFTPVQAITVSGPAPAPVNGAAFVSQSAPSSMTAGQSYAVTVTMRNTGTTTWTSAGAYHLGAQDPQDNTTWGLGRVLLPSGTTSVAPGASVTFAFTVKAPATAGSYPFQWRMVQDGVQWFGDFTPAQTITVQ